MPGHWRGRKNPRRNMTMEKEVLNCLFSDRMEHTFARRTPRDSGSATISQRAARFSGSFVLWLFAVHFVDIERRTEEEGKRVKEKEGSRGKENMRENRTEPARDDRFSHSLGELYGQKMVESRDPFDWFRVFKITDLCGLSNFNLIS